MVLPCKEMVKVGSRKSKHQKERHARKGDCQRCDEITSTALDPVSNQSTQPLAGGGSTALTAAGENHGAKALR